MTLFRIFSRIPLPPARLFLASLFILVVLIAPAHKAGAAVQEPSRLSEISATSSDIANNNSIFSRGVAGISSFFTTLPQRVSGYVSSLFTSTAPVASTPAPAIQVLSVTEQVVVPQAEQAPVPPEPVVPVTYQAPAVSPVVITQGVSQTYVDNAVTSLRQQMYRMFDAHLDRSHEDNDRVSSAGDTSADDLSDNTLDDLSDVGVSSPAYGNLLYWNGSAWSSIATSSLGIVGGGGGSFATTSADYWFDTITTDSLNEGTTNKYYADTLVNAFVSASTSIAKTYTNNNFAGTNTFTAAGLTVSGVTDGCVEFVSGKFTSTGTSCGSGGGGGITSLNGLTTGAQTFATSSDTNITLSVVSSGSTHTFVPGWTGTLAASRGGTGISAPVANQLLLGTSGGWTQVATSSLGLPTFASLTSYLTLSEWRATTTDALTEGGTNQYFTTARVASVIAGTTTDALTEGTTNKYYADALARAAFSSTATGLTYTSGTGVFSLTSGYTIPLTASTTEWASAYANRITSASAPLSFSAGTLSITAANTSTNGYLSSTDWNSFNARLSTTTLGLFDKGYFFSTTSADHWKTANNFFSTTSAGYWLTQQSTSNLAEGANLYYTPTRVAGVIAGTTTDALAEGSTNQYFTTSRADARIAAGTTTIRGMVSAGTGLTYTAGQFALDVTGDWTGVFDGQDGSYYLSRANHTGTQLASTISDFSSTARGLVSSTATGLTYTSGTGVFSLTGGYTIPLTASTTEWASAYANRITSTTYPLQLASNTLSLAFGTSTTNTWGGTQTFTNAPVLGSLNGLVYGASGTLGAASVSSPLSFSGGTLSIAVADAGTNGYLSSSNWSLFNNKVSSTSLSATGPLTYNSASGVFGLDTVGAAYGGTGSTTLSGILAGNGTSGVKTAVVGSGLSWDGTTLSASGSNFFTNSGSSTYLTTGSLLGLGTTSPDATLTINGNPASGKLLSIVAPSYATSTTIVRTYTANATWTKPANLVSVKVEVIGAGGGGSGGHERQYGYSGGAGAAGGNSVFSYNSGANVITGGGGGGGSGSVSSPTRGVAGTASGGDINVSGNAGATSSSAYGAAGATGVTTILDGYAGSGGYSNHSNSAGGAGGTGTGAGGGGGGTDGYSGTPLGGASGGSGGYASKTIAAGSIGASASITVGVGGGGGGGASYASAGNAASGGSGGGGGNAGGSPGPGSGGSYSTSGVNRGGSGGSKGGGGRDGIGSAGGGGGAGDTYGSYSGGGGGGGAAGLVIVTEYYEGPAQTFSVLTVTTEGSVGIGTTSPKASLTVAGMLDSKNALLNVAGRRSSITRIYNKSGTWTKPTGLSYATIEVVGGGGGGAGSTVYYSSNTGYGGSGGAGSASQVVLAGGTVTGGGGNGGSYGASWGGGTGGSGGTPANSFSGSSRSGANGYAVQGTIPGNGAHSVIDGTSPTAGAGGGSAIGGIAGIGYGAGGGAGGYQSSGYPGGGGGSGAYVIATVPAASIGTTSTVTVGYGGGGGGGGAAMTGYPNSTYNGSNGSGSTGGAGGNDTSYSSGGTSYTTGSPGGGAGGVGATTVAATVGSPGYGGGGGGGGAGYMATGSYYSGYGGGGGAPGIVIITEYYDTPQAIDALNVTATGNVGIGNASATYLLDVGTANQVGPVARFVNSTGYCTINPTTAGISCSSDQRLKKNIEDVETEDALAKISALAPVLYNWNAEDDAASKHAGFIAQEVQQLLPDLVSVDEEGFLSVNYAGFTPYLVSALQQTNARIDTLGFSTTTLTVGTTTEAIEAFFAENKTEPLRDVRAFFTDLFTRGIHPVADMVTARITAIQGYFLRVHTQEVCVGQTCIDEATLKAILERTDLQATSTPDAVVPEPEVEDVSTTTPESSDTPAPEPVTSDVPSDTSTEADTVTSTEPEPEAPPDSVEGEVTQSVEESPPEPVPESADPPAES